MEIQVIQVKRGRPVKPKPVKPKVEVEKVAAQRGRPRKPRPEGESEPVVIKPRHPEKPSLYKDDPKAYFRAYYDNRCKVESVCEHCGNKFDSTRTLNSHLRRSVLCKKIREMSMENKDN